MLLVSPLVFLPGFCLIFVLFCFVVLTLQRNGVFFKATDAENEGTIRPGQEFAACAFSRALFKHPEGSEPDFAETELLILHRVHMFPWHNVTPSLREETRELRQKLQEHLFALHTRARRVQEQSSSSRDKGGHQPLSKEAAESFLSTPLFLDHPELRNTLNNSKRLVCFQEQEPIAE